jgi:uncharacterized protein (UPF0179 family)
MQFRDTLTKRYKIVKAKIKFFRCLIKHHEVKAYEGEEKPYACLTSALDMLSVS